MGEGDAQPLSNATWRPALFLSLLSLLYAPFYCIVPIRRTVPTSPRQSLNFRIVDFISAFTQKIYSRDYMLVLHHDYLVSLLMPKL